MKYLYLCLLILCALNASLAQKPSEKTIKFKNVHCPIVPLNDVKSYKVVIHNGNIKVDLFALKEKKGLTSKLQGWQDDINNKTPDYYSYTNFRLEADKPDATIEFSFGTFRQNSMETREHKIPCVIKGQKISKETVRECPAYYYEFKYELPYVIRITSKSGDIILNEHSTGEGVHTFGYDASGMSGYLNKQELHTAYEKAMDKNQSFIAEKALISKLEENEAFIQNAFYFSTFTEKIDIATATGKGFDYAGLDQAQKFAITAFDKLSKGDGPGARADFGKAIPVWKTEAGAVDLGNDNARINRKIATALYSNLTYAYLHLWELDSAALYLSEANRVGRFSNRSQDFTDLSDLISKRKEQLAVYKINKDIRGTQVKAENLLEKIRVRQKDALYNPLTNENNYHAYAQTIKRKEESSQVKMFEELLGGLGGSANSNSQSNKFEGKVQKTGFQGYILIITSLMDGTMDTLSRDICGLTYLNELNISNNTLKFIPSDIGKLTDLKKLQLNNNQLTTLPQEIALLKNLKVLSVKGNKIPKEEIAKLQEMLPKCKIKS